MGNSKTANKRRLAAKRSTGTWKSKKDSENDPPVSTLAGPRPQKAVVNKVVKDVANNVAVETKEKDGDIEAAAVLMSMRKTKPPVDQVFVQVTNIDLVNSYIMLCFLWQIMSGTLHNDYRYIFYLSVFF